MVIVDQVKFMVTGLSLVILLIQEFLTKSEVSDCVFIKTNTGAHSFHLLYPCATCGKKEDCFSHHIARQRCRK